ncbi:MAG: rhomboid family intramembrane serine protease [Treponemataceae bacterium]|nr:rhomboid family intramembrane serine protease [Treponemataceae bacterium]
MASKSNKNFTLGFDSPVTLILVMLLVLLAIIQRLFPSISWLFFCPCRGGNIAAFDYKSISDYFRILLFPFGFSNWNFLTANIVFILFLGPRVELNFGRLITCLLLLVTTVVSGVICVCFASSVIYGTSGIVCMLLILGIYISIDKKSIPLSYILLAVIYFAREIISIIDANSLETFCHFVGALASSLVGILAITLGEKK